MSRPWLVVVAALGLVACSSPHDVASELDVQALSNHHARTFVATLSGAEEVPPADTRARGQA